MTENVSGTIELEQLGVGYGRQLLLGGFSMTVQPGEIVTLCGPNGSGKSTLLKSLVRELPLIEGRIYLKGRDMTAISSHELARDMSALLTSRVRTEYMTCYEVICMGRYPYTGRLGILSEKDHEAAQKALRMVHLEELKDALFDQISDGQKQRVLLARAICQEPELLILDEPTSYLDINYKLELMSILKKLAAEGVSILMSLHELDLALMVSDRLVCVTGDHRIDRITEKGETLTDDYIEQLFQMETGSYARFRKGIL